MQLEQFGDPEVSTVPTRGRELLSVAGIHVQRIQRRETTNFSSKEVGSLEELSDLRIPAMPRHSRIYFDKFRAAR